MSPLKVLAVPCAAAVLLSASPGLAQSTLQRMENFESTGANLNIETVPQTGPHADAIKKNLEKIKLPEGFKISLYAVVPDARQIAVGPSAGVVFVGTRKTRIWAVTDRDKSRVASE